MAQPVFRFAPSPNGDLHLGHAYSALLNLQLARSMDAKMLLRIEDIDPVRCTPERERQMLCDLEWLGFEWDEAPQRQSERIDEYRNIIEQLEQEELVYPTIASRGEIKKQIEEIQISGVDWPHDPDGVPHYPGSERDAPLQERNALKNGPKPCSFRLDTAKALSRINRPLFWTETGFGRDMLSQDIPCHPEQWGDVLLGRKDFPASYHLACVLDDAAQEISHVVRGKDLYHATSIHRTLQELLNLPAPLYHHHELILDEDGNKLSKSRQDTSLRDLRQSGVTAEEIRERLFSDAGYSSPD